MTHQAVRDEPVAPDERERQMTWLGEHPQHSIAHNILETLRADAGKDAMIDSLRKLNVELGNYNNTLQGKLSERDAKLAKVRDCYEAAMCEGWDQALADDDIELLRDIWNRRLSALTAVAKPVDEGRK